ncbi:flagellar hook-associated protein FlgK [Salibacterium halotolerans]|uniref:Flagellar hook-associated protein 1 n=1 Tax=Salibacterium halotolerans TaxID=1884432 RepID=A0A1I5WZ07_9BACI|nr:flagellar hook-associated protein FlgK [Salibacterium halotolerans]SFQ24747.1 flagellar hook-associated protein 1 FlgK [Salibacterium halotolerans]
MTSTFHGLETALRGMRTQQAALHTTGHNISNANTEGYSRQRVNFGQTEPYPAAARNAPEIPGQIGTGVQADFVQRIREGYLDQQFRGENAQSGYWEARHSSLERMEGLLNEPSDQGLSSKMNQFYDALQDLSANPEDSGARAVVKERGIALADSFNYMSDKLSSNKADLANQIGTNEKEINSILSNINSVNKQIGSVEPNGQIPNDLYDERDRLLDDLSKRMNIEVENLEPEGLANSAAEGKVNVYLLNGEGERMTDGDGNDIKLIDGNNLDHRTIDIESGSDNTETNTSGEDNGRMGNVQLSWESGSGSTADIDIKKSPGSLAGMLEMHDGKNAAGEDLSGTYPDLMSKLNELAYNFASNFNTQHEKGTDLNGDDGGNFFTVSGTPEAATISVAEDIKENPDKIAASLDGNAGDGSNATELSNIKSDHFDEEYQSLIGEYGVETSEAKQMMDNSATLRDNVDSRRMEVSSVSLDEEMTNMIQFQQAYNAAARNITAVDEMLDRIINNMGRVGI